MNIKTLEVVGLMIKSLLINYLLNVDDFVIAIQRLINLTHWSFISVYGLQTMSEPVYITRCHDHNVINNISVW